MAQNPSQTVTKSNSAFNDAVIISYVTSNGMTLTGKDLKGNSDSPTAVLNQNLLAWAGESNEIRYVSMTNILLEVRTEHFTTVRREFITTQW
jgi:hypothetical protein